MATKNQPIALVEQTETSTRLGYILQGIIESCLRESSKGKSRIHANAQYAEGIIKPDILIGDLSKPTHSIHVTCSDSRDSFRMKRWRYVCELFQLKGHCRTVFSINVMFGTPGLYQPADVIFLERLFDATVDLTRDPEGRAVYRKALSALASGMTTQDAVAAIAGGLSKAERNGLVDEIARLVAGHGAGQRDLWRLPQITIKPNWRYNSGVASDFRGAFLRALLLDDRCFKKLRSFLEGERIVPPRDAIVAGLISMSEEIDGDSYELRPGVKEIISASLIALRRDVCADPSIGRLIAEARGESTQLSWIRRCLAIMTPPPTKKAVKDVIAIAGEHPRELFIDCLVAIYDCSVNRMETLWDHGRVPVGIKNPVANIVSRTGFIKLSEDELASGLVLIWKALAQKRTAAITAQQVIERVIAYRRYCLTKGSIVNPLDSLLSQSLVKLGYRSLGKKRFASSRLRGSPLSTEFLHAFENPRNRMRFAIKNLYGDSGADHKAEEMAGRLYLLPYVLSDDSASVDLEAQRWKFVFIPEGFWAKDHLNLLGAAGWNVVPAIALADRLRSLVGKP